MGALKRAIIAAGSAAVLALAACSGGSVGSTGAGATPGSAGDAGATASLAADGTAATGTAGQTDALLLERQLELLEVGEGYLQCGKDLETLGEPFSSGPSVWISSGLADPLELWSSGLPFVTLCLQGFSSSAPIELTTVAGDFAVSSTAVPVEEITVRYGFQSPHTLFEDGSRLQVADYTGMENPEAMILQSPYWSFLPPAEVFREMSTSDSITIRAYQRGLSAETVQSFRPPTEPGSFLVTPLPIGTCGCWCGAIRRVRLSRSGSTR